MTSIFLLLVFVLLFLYRVEVATLVLHPSRSIDRLINRSVVMKAPHALTTKSDLGLFSPVTSSNEDITISRGYYCKYQLAERPVQQGIICETSGKRASQTSNKNTTAQSTLGDTGSLTFILSYRNCKCYSFLSENHVHYASKNKFERFWI